MSPLSCGTVQQGVCLGGSAGVKTKMVFKVLPYHSKHTSCATIGANMATCLPCVHMHQMTVTQQKTSLTGSWSLWCNIKCGMWNLLLSWKRENMKPHTGKHETLNEWSSRYRPATRKQFVSNWCDCGCTPTVRTQEHQQDSLQCNYGVTIESVFLVNLP